MIKLNNSANHALRYVDGYDVYGQFYCSQDKKLHLAAYEPYVYPPRISLCGGINSGFSPSRQDSPDREICTDCYAAIGADI